jgi:hypothetical protein
MKNFIFSLFLLALMQFPAIAAQQMRDMSLSVEETNKQLNTPQTKPSNTTNNTNGADYDNGTGFDSSVPLDPNMAKQLRDINARNAAGRDALGRDTLGNNINGRDVFGINNNNVNTNSQGNYLPRRGTIPPPHRGLGKQGFMAYFCDDGYQCEDAQRQQSCERYKRAAVNVQRLLDRTIDCEVNNASYKSGCDGLDAGRLDLLKQYWQDEDESYTILFLPDMVLNSAATCTSLAKQGGIQ